MDDLGELLGYLVAGLLILAIIILIIVYIILPLLAASMGIGALYGGGHAVYNYAKAFKKNIKPERIR